MSNSLTGDYDAVLEVAMRQLNGCCSRRPTSAWFGVNLPDHRGRWRRRIPTQILEMAWATALFGAAILLRDRKLPAGAIFCLAVVTYGTGGM
jgi:prolipoprotein diacylglyceryltransferase